MDRLFTAQDSESTLLNGSPVAPLTASSITNTTIGIVFWQGNMDIFTPLLAKLTAAGGKIIDLCSVAYMDALVSCGELAAVIFPGFSAHDSAAANSSIYTQIQSLLR